MADKDRTPEDLLGSLLSGKKPGVQKPADQQPGRPEEETAGKPEDQHTGIPASHNTIKTARKKREPAARPAPAKEQEEAPGDKVKATFYISTQAVDSLEEGWIRLRRLAPKEQRGQISKSLIVELAVQMALEELKSKGEKSLLARKISKG